MLVIDELAALTAYTDPDTQAGGVPAAGRDPDPGPRPRGGGRWRACRTRARRSSPCAACSPRPSPSGCARPRRPGWSSGDGIRRRARRTGSPRLPGHRVGGRRGRHRRPGPGRLLVRRPAAPGRRRPPRPGGRGTSPPAARARRTSEDAPDAGRAVDLGGASPACSCVSLALRVSAHGAPSRPRRGRGPGGLTGSDRSSLASSPSPRVRGVRGGGRLDLSGLGPTVERQDRGPVDVAGLRRLVRRRRPGRSLRPPIRLRGCAATPSTPPPARSSAPSPRAEARSG